MELAVPVGDGDPGAEGEGCSLGKPSHPGGVADGHHQVQQRSLGDVPHGGRQMSVFWTGDPTRGCPK